MDRENLEGHRAVFQGRITYVIAHWQTLAFNHFLASKTSLVDYIQCIPLSFISLNECVSCLFQHI